MTFQKYFSLMRLWVVAAFAALGTSVNQKTAAAEANANAYTDTLAGGLRTTVDKLDAAQSATSAKVDNLALYAANTQAVPYTVKHGSTDNLADIIGAIPNEKALFIVTVGGDFADRATLSNGGTDYTVDNGDCLYVTTQSGAITSVTHTDDRANVFLENVTAKIDALSDGMETEMLLWKTQLEAAVPGLFLA